MVRTKWTERFFTFDFPEGWIFNILERLQGTEARIKSMTDDLTSSQLQFRNDGWSIQEHVGHLLDLEALHEGRIDDFLNRKEILRAADMQNLKTGEANHNQRNFADIISEFHVSRSRFIKRLSELDDDTSHFRSLHPRLKVMVRPVDIAYFTAEHDDHHLATMRTLLNSL